MSQGINSLFLVRRSLMYFAAQRQLIMCSIIFTSVFPTFLTGGARFLQCTINKNCFLVINNIPGCTDDILYCVMLCCSRSQWWLAFLCRDGVLWPRHIPAGAATAVVSVEQATSAPTCIGSANRVGSIYDAGRINHWMSVRLFPIDMR